MTASTTTSFRLTEKENEILQDILREHPFLPQTKAAALRYALFYWAKDPTCPDCGYKLVRSIEGDSFWHCGNPEETHP